MKGIDKFDKNIEYCRYSHRLLNVNFFFIHLLDIALFNACILYKQGSRKHYFL